LLLHAKHCSVRWLFSAVISQIMFMMLSLQWQCRHHEKPFI